MDMQKAFSTMKDIVLERENQIKMMAAHVVNVYPFRNYPIFKKTPKALDLSGTLIDRISRKKNRYQQEGMLRTVQAVLLVYVNDCPSVLFLKGGTEIYKLPGGRLMQGENEIEGFRRTLTSHLGVPLLDLAHHAHLLEWQVFGPVISSIPEHLSRFQFHAIWPPWTPFSGSIYLPTLQ